MNQYAEEIHKELEAFAKKYHITKGILLIEETDSNDTSKKNARAILFQPDPTVKLSIHDFALFYEAVVKVSKTFREICNHLTIHLLDKAIESALTETTIEHRMNKKGGKRAD